MQGVRIITSIFVRLILHQSADLIHFESYFELLQ